MTWSSNSHPGRAGLTEAGRARSPEPSLWSELKSPEELAVQAREIEAERAQAQAEARHTNEVDEAYRRGVAEGREAGERRAHMELAAAIRAAESALDGLIEAEEAHTRDLNENLAALSVAIARRIVDRELEIDPDTVRTLVRTVVAMFPQEQRLKIRVNPRDMAQIAESLDAGRDDGNAGGGRDIRWVADDGVVHGGCVVEGPDRVVDGRVDRALERLFWAVRDA